jgi:hypothetical protein
MTNLGSESGEADDVEKGQFPGGNMNNRKSVRGLDDGGVEAHTGF